MGREALRGFLQIGIFIAGAGFCSATVQPRDRGEFVVSVCSMAIGIVLIIGVVIALRLIK